MLKILCDGNVEFQAVDAVETTYLRSSSSLNFGSTKPFPMTDCEQKEDMVRGTRCGGEILESPGVMS